MFNDSKGLHPTSSTPLCFCSLIPLELYPPRTYFFSAKRAFGKNTKYIPLHFACTVRFVQRASQLSGRRLLSPRLLSPRLLSPVIILPGLGNASTDYEKLAGTLLSRGHETVSIAPVQRWQWGLNVKGFFMVDYWRSQLKPNAILEWYFDKIDCAVAEVLERCGNTCHINVLGHSAGGWLGRAYIAERAPSNLRVSTFLTLGTPHIAPPHGRLDQTRGLLRYVEENCDVSDIVSRFVCVVGRGTIGKPLGEGSFGEFVAYLSYSAVCGRGTVDGDGVIPVDSACGRSGEAVYCNNCHHSMLTSSSWYGSERALRDWVEYLT